MGKNLSGIFKMKSFYNKKKIAVIGGAGFIGQNIIKELHNLKSDITLVDCNIEKDTEKYKTNEYLIKKVNKIISTDITEDFKSLEKIIKSNDIIINLIGYRGEEIYKSLKFNCIFHLKFLELCKMKKNLVVVHVGSRLEYGPQKNIPVKETAHLNPDTIYGLHKFIGEKYYLYFAKKFNIHTLCFRLSNVYGPHTNFRNSTSIFNYLIFRAFKGNNITIFGKGEQYKDPLYIKDAVQGILETLRNKKCYGETFNIGLGKKRRFKDIANMIMKEVNPNTKIVYKKVKSKDYSFVADIAKIKKITGWSPKTDLKEGLTLIREYLNKTEL